MKITRILIVLTLFCFCINVKGQIANQNDSLILVELNDTLDFYSFPAIKWNYSQPVSTWFGVELTEDGRVARIPDFEEMTLNLGEIYQVPNTILELDSLERLDFRKVGTSELDWDGLSSLPLRFLAVDDYNWLDRAEEILDFNQLDTLIASVISSDLVQFPNEIWRIPEVQVVEMRSGFTGQMNDVVDSASNNSSSIRRLCIKGTLLEGTIPESIGALSNLEELLFSDNPVSGSLPQSIGNLKDLKILHLNRSELNGELPNTLFDLTELEELNLVGNLFEGSLSGQFENFVHLERLVIGSNQFAGTIPQEIAALPALKVLSMDKNQLTGSIPELLGCAQSGGLEGVNFDNNYLSGEIPPCLLENEKEIPKGVSLQLSNNSFRDPIDEFNRMGWRKLFIHNNFYTFEDFIHLIDFFQGIGENIVYAPQGMAGKRDTVLAYIDNDALIELSFDDTVSTNTYFWFKDGLPFDTIVGANELRIEQVQHEDAGLYHAEIVNSIAPDLRLMTHPILLNVEIDVNVTENGIHPVKLYPNPVIDLVTIENFDAGKHQLGLYNSLGQKVLDFHSETLDLSFLSAGLYFVIGNANGQKIHKRLVKIR